jgi:hypothetical protein
MQELSVNKEETYRSLVPTEMYGAGAWCQKRGNIQELRGKKVAICLSFVSTERNQEHDHERSVKREATCKSLVSKRGNIQEPKMMNLCD